MRIKRKTITINHKSSHNDSHECLHTLGSFVNISATWRGGRVAEGAPLLREYGGNLIEGSNPSLSDIQNTTTAQQNKNPAAAQSIVVTEYQHILPHGYLDKNTQLCYVYTVPWELS